MPSITSAATANPAIAWRNALVSLACPCLICSIALLGALEARAVDAHPVANCERRVRVLRQRPHPTGFPKDRGAPGRMLFLIAFDCISGGNAPFGGAHRHYRSRIVPADLVAQQSAPHA